MVNNNTINETMVKHTKKKEKERKEKEFRSHGNCFFFLITDPLAIYEHVFFIAKKDLC